MMVHHYLSRFLIMRWTRLNCPSPLRFLIFLSNVWLFSAFLCLFICPFPSFIWPYLALVLWSYLRFLASSLPDVVTHRPYLLCLSIWTHLLCSLPPSLLPFLHSVMSQTHQCKCILSSSQLLHPSFVPALTPYCVFMTLTNALLPLFLSGTWLILKSPVRPPIVDKF